MMKNDFEYDVVVAGSGAGGMLAAIRCHDLKLRPIVIEKSDRYGGTSAVSGGAIWIPNNPDIGARDSRENALAYLVACTEGKASLAKLQQYVSQAPEMLAHIRELGAEYYADPGSSYPDYYPANSGAVAHGRTMLVKPMEDGWSALGEEFFRMRESYPEFKLFDKISVDLAEGGALLHRSQGWVRVLFRLLRRYYGDRSFRRLTYRDRRLTIGNALIGRLRKAMLDRNIPLLLKTKLTGIVSDGMRVTGIRADRDGRQIVIAARRGVVLASGGFEHSQHLRDRYLDQPTDERWSATPRDNNVGEGLLAALEVGADEEFMNEAWWAPSIALPSKSSPNSIRNQALFFERGFPHCMIVNRLGKRFANEILSYHQFGQAMLRDNVATRANLPSWFISDATYRQKYPLGSLSPGSVTPDRKLPPEWGDNFFYRSDSVEGLAEKIGLPRSTLSQSVTRFNSYAAKGVDEEFGRGGDVYGQFFGDPKHGPNRVLGPIASPPFYAVRVDLGDLGTKGGPKTNEDAVVLGRDSRPIEGLYAIGNASGAVMGGAYPGAAATLGVAMTFACIAASHLARAEASAVLETKTRLSISAT